MKHFIAMLFELPLCMVLPAGIKAITGLSTWWCIPIAIILLLSYIKGYEMLKRLGYVQIMKLFIAFLLQLPVSVVLCLGLSKITGLNDWLCILIALMLLVSYDIGSEGTRRYR